MYAKYDHESFSGFAPANELMDLDNIDYALLNAAMFYETNRQRVLNGVAPGKHSIALEKIAFDHTVNMVKLDFFSHTSVVPGMEDMSDRLTSVGISNAASGENIATNFGLNHDSSKAFYTPSTNGGFFSYEYQGTPIPAHSYNSFAIAILDQWMHSPGHRANILAGYAFMGCAGYAVPKTGYDEMPGMKGTQNFSNVPGDSTVTIDYGAYSKTKAPQAQPAASRYTAPAANNTYADSTPYSSEKERKQRKTGSKRLTMQLGGGGSLFLGDPEAPSFSPLNIGYSAEAHLGLRVGKNYKHSIGVFGRYGSLPGAAAAGITGAFALHNPALIDSTQATNYLDIEAGFILWRFLRLSAGQSRASIAATDGSAIDTSLGTATLGVQIRIKKVKWYVNGTTYFDDSFNTFYLRPSTGLIVQFNFLRFN